MPLKTDDKDTWDASWITGNLPPSIGHGEALTYPDDMWRRWSYSNNKDNTIDKDNQEIFLAITKNIQSLIVELGYNVNALSKPQLRK